MRKSSGRSHEGTSGYHISGSSSNGEEEDCIIVGVSEVPTPVERTTRDSSRGEEDLGGQYRSDRHSETSESDGGKGKQERGSVHPVDEDSRKQDGNQGAPSEKRLSPSWTLRSNERGTVSPAGSSMSYARDNRRPSLDPSADANMVGIANSCLSLMEGAGPLTAEKTTMTSPLTAARECDNTDTGHDDDEGAVRTVSSAEDPPTIDDMVRRMDEQDRTIAALATRVGVQDTLINQLRGQISRLTQDSASTRTELNEWKASAFRHSENVAQLRKDWRKVNDCSNMFRDQTRS